MNTAINPAGFGFLQEVWPDTGTRRSQPAPQLPEIPQGIRLDTGLSSARESYYVEFDNSTAPMVNLLDCFERTPHGRPIRNKEETRKMAFPYPPEPDL